MSLEIQANTVKRAYRGTRDPTSPLRIDQRPELYLLDTSRRNPSQTVFFGLLFAAVADIFVLITLGGVVRITESGLACPDWPLCYGRVLPPFEFHALLEYSHRLVASLAGALVLVATLVAWLKYRHLRWGVGLLTACVPLLVLAALLGREAVLTELTPWVVTIHLTLAQIVFGLLLASLVAFRWPPPETLPSLGPLPWTTLTAVGLVFLMTTTGSYMVGQGGSTACPQWPLCDGSLLPNGKLPWIHMAHRIVVLFGSLILIPVTIRIWRLRRYWPPLGVIGALAGLALVAQILVGAANSWFHFLPVAQALHLSLATLLWGSVVIMMSLVWQGAGAAAKRSLPLEDVPRARSNVLTDYINLTKPRIILLLLVTALGGLFLAAKGVPPLWTTVLVLAGGAMAAGGANALNHYMDRDIDAQMFRTRDRPLPGRRVNPICALVFGIGLNLAAFLILATGVNLLSALLTLGATLFYVLVYTGWLKRSTPQNIVIGGAAGAIPPVVGWVAITGSVDLPALYLFAIVFFWTPPHFWALALLLRGDYARAAIPMLPVVKGERETVRSMLLHAIILVTITILFVTVGVVGSLYVVVSLILGTVFLIMTWRVWRSVGATGTRSLYIYSLAYLFLLFGGIMADSLLTPH